MALGAVTLLLTGWVNFRTCRRLGLLDWAGPTAFVALTFGTGLFHFASYDAGFSHVYSALGLAILLDRFVAGRVGVGTAAVVVLLVLVRNTNVLAVAALTLGHFARRRSWRDLLVVVLAGAVGCGVQLGLNAHAHGRLVLSSYGGERFLLDRPMALSVLFSAKKGLFAYYPVLAVVLAGGLLDRRTRPATALYAGLLLAFAGVYGCWHSWWLGGGFGHRGFVELVPLAVPLFAAVLADAGRMRRAVLLTATGLCLLLTLRLMAGYWRGDLPFEDVTPDCYRAVLVNR